MASTDFTVADVLAWARTKPADEAYNYYDPRCCAIAQFGIATGREYLVDIDNLHQRYPEIEPAIVASGDFRPNEERWTFGELVKRLERLCPDAPVPPSEWTKLDAYMADGLDGLIDEFARTGQSA